MKIPKAQQARRLSAAIRTAGQNLMVLVGKEHAPHFKTVPKDGNTYIVQDPLHPGVHHMTCADGSYMRLEAVFRVKRLSQVAKKLGKPLEPATFTKEVLAQMVLDLLNKNVCHGQVFRRLHTEELRAIPLPYRSTVAHWQNGMELLDMVASERVLKEQARYIWQNHKIDIIKGERPDSINESLSLVDVLAPKQFIPVPAVIRDNPNLFHTVDMNKHRKKLAEQLAESLGEE